MAIFINERKMVEDNTFEFENRVKSPTSRFLDSTQTYTTYYHINVDETTADSGFSDVHNIIGFKSPIRYNKINGFPLYGIDQIALDLQDTDVGLDTTYESTGIILPNTIKPVPNDFFIIDILQEPFIFRITDVDYDTVMPDNFYRISFALEYNDEVKLEELNKQVMEEFVCKIENIGTENNFIISSEAYAKQQDVLVMYHKITDFYKTLFYNERYNSFIAQLPDYSYFYDPLQADFINKFSLFNEKRNLETLILADQYPDNKRNYKYHKSIYKYIELKDKRLLTNFPYILRPGATIRGSAFNTWRDKKIKVLDIPDRIPEGSRYILSEDFINSIKMNIPSENTVNEFIRRYLVGEDLGINDIPLNMDEELLYFNNSLEVYFMVPIILYIIRTIIKKENKK